MDIWEKSEKWEKENYQIIRGNYSRKNYPSLKVKPMEIKPLKFSFPKPEIRKMKRSSLYVDYKSFLALKSASECFDASFKPDYERLERILAFEIDNTIGSVRKYLPGLIKEKRESNIKGISGEEITERRLARQKKYIDQETEERNDSVIVSIDGYSIDFATGKIKRNTSLKPGIHFRQSRLVGK
jgi:hypothetical protein